MNQPNPAPESAEQPSNEQFVKSIWPDAYEVHEDDWHGIYTPRPSLMREWLGSDWQDVRAKHPRAIALDKPAEQPQAPQRHSLTISCQHGRYTATCSSCGVVAAQESAVNAEGFVQAIAAEHSQCNALEAQLSAALEREKEKDAGLRDAAQTLRCRA